jgi:hypothetical protein
MDNIVWLIWLGLYAYFALTLQTIGNKTGWKETWMAWIPIANLYMMCKIAKRPGWWVVLLLIPFINIVFMMLVWMGIAEARNKPAWLGVLVLIPIANLILPAHLAFSK